VPQGQSCQVNHSLTLYLKKEYQQILRIISDKIEISNFQDTLDLMAGVIFLIGLSFFWIGRGVSKEEANVI